MVSEGYKKLPLSEINPSLDHWKLDDRYMSSEMVNIAKNGHRVIGRNPL
ncbi:MAG TPA: hypothetical protein V6D10_01145 [Trichocoleus sp.]|jgi:hypothetical protein